MSIYLIDVYTDGASRRHLYTVLSHAFATRKAAEHWIEANPPVTGQVYVIVRVPVFN